MGTALTGTEIKDTYDSLIKVTDNGPISGTAKYLSDGLGNDSALALSTGNIGIGTDSPVTKLSVSDGTNCLHVGYDASGPYISGANNPFTVYKRLSYDATDHVFYSSSAEAMRITSAGNVGIGTSSPSEVLHIKGNQRISAPTGTSVSAVLDLYGNNSNTYGGSNVVRSRIESLTAGDAFGSILKFYTNDSSNALQERMTITSAGNVGIGTSSPDGKLDVASAGNLVSTGAFTNPHLALTLTGSPVDNDSFVGITYATSDAANYGWSMGAKRETGGNGYLDIRQHFNSATGTQIARFTGNGLCFGSDTAAANALDDYEEGTWTPVISDGTNNATMTDTYNEGKYVKVGKMVHLSAYVLTDSLGSVTGNIIITGLPFTNSNGFGFLVGGIAGAGGNLNLTAGQNVTLTISTASNYIILNVWDATTGTNPMTASQWSADGQMQIGITYLAA